MKTVTAKDAKNRFGQLIDDAQRQPVTVEKNGRPFVVVQSFEDFQMAQKLKMTSLRAAIDEARTEYAEGRGVPFDQAAVEKIAATGRQKLSERDRKK
jgi:prevent-host-death family protein